MKIKISESKLCWPFDVTLDEDKCFVMAGDGYDITCCPEQAKELLPLLQHYVETGELPE